MSRMARTSARYRPASLPTPPPTLLPALTSRPRIGIYLTGRFNHTVKSVDERATEERILSAANAVFLKRGTAGARMQEVADEAGVNKALLHYYFGSKEGLALAVFRRALAALLPRVVEILCSEAPLEDKVRRVVAVETEELARSPFLPGYVLSELTHHPERVREAFESAVGTKVEEMGGRVLASLGRQLEEESRAGRMRPVSPEYLVLNLFSLVMFPFAGAPLLQEILGVGEEGYAALLEERKERLPEFILNAMRP